MFTWEEAGLLRGMVQVIVWVLVVALLIAAFWLAQRFGWLSAVL